MEYARATPVVIDSFPAKIAPIRTPDVIPVRDAPSTARSIYKRFVPNVNPSTYSIKNTSSKLHIPCTISPASDDARIIVNFDTGDTPRRLPCSEPVGAIPLIISDDNHEP